MACTGPGGSVSKNITVTVSQVQPTKLADGVECSSYDQCQSNYCYAGPENKKYCVNRDLNCAQRFADALRAGVIGINDPRPITPEAPFGGVGQSGMGREGGIEGLLEFMDARLIGLRLPG